MKLQTTPMSVKPYASQSQMPQRQGILNVEVELHHTPLRLFANNNMPVPVMTSIASRLQQLMTDQLLFLGDSLPESSKLTLISTLERTEEKIRALESTVQKKTRTKRIKQLNTIYHQNLSWVELEELYHQSLSKTDLKIPAPVDLSCLNPSSHKSIRINQQNRLPKPLITRVSMMFHPAHQKDPAELSLHVNLGEPQAEQNLVATILTRFKTLGWLTVKQIKALKLSNPDELSAVYEAFYKINNNPSTSRIPYVHILKKGNLTP